MREIGCFLLYDREFGVLITFQEGKSSCTRGHHQARRSQTSCDREDARELVDLVALGENGSNGPPQELTWPQMETLGHGEREFYVARQSLA